MQGFCSNRSFWTHRGSFEPLKCWLNSKWLFFIFLAVCRRIGYAIIFPICSIFNSSSSHQSPPPLGKNCFLMHTSVSMQKLFLIRYRIGKQELSGSVTPMSFLLRQDYILHFLPGNKGCSKSSLRCDLNMIHFICNLCIDAITHSRTGVIIIVAISDTEVASVMSGCGWSLTQTLNSWQA